MAAYIIQRIAGAVILLFAVAAITFAIFFLVPRLAGVTTTQLAAQYVGRDQPGST